VGEPVATTLCEINTKGTDARLKTIEHEHFAAK
jgi:hypothetical protein